MLKRRLGRRGVAGFFEEIPAAATAIVALLLFFSALVSGLGNLYTRQQSSDFSSEAETFLEGLVGYQNLTYLDQWGIFDNYSMQALTINDITYSFHPEFQYNLTISDISDYHPYPRGKFPTKWLATGTFPTSTSGLQQGWVRDTTTVDVWVVPAFGFDQYHQATLTVVIWS
jgi:hypothetical protein